MCPLCAYDSDTVEDRTDDGIVFITCTHPSHDEPFVWERPPEQRSVRAGDGIGVELGIWDKLLECVIAGEEAVQYGVVEDRLFERYPAESAELIRRYGHAWRDPQHPSDRFSASAYLAARLSDLAAEGHLIKTFGRATGRWAYNGTISYWQVAGDSPSRTPRASGES